MIMDRNTLDRLVTVFDQPHYNRLALQLRDDFRAASPFPHAIIDDFLPTDVATIIAESFPDPSDRSLPWTVHQNENTSRKFLDDVCAMPVPMRIFTQSLNSRSFLLFLETLSGINCLLADPYFIGGGAMVSGHGDFLKVHADFNWHHKIQAHRRVNALLYLTPDWRTEWRGDLELWPTDGDGPLTSISPQFNRLVVFAVTDHANHGQPTPLN